MPIRCPEISEVLRADFGTLWRCRELGQTLEITTPYILPNDDGLPLYLTERDDRIIVSDGGFVEEYIDENCKVDRAKREGITAAICDRYGVKIHAQNDRRIYYFKETTQTKLVSSLAFDVGNFGVALCNALSTHVETEEGIQEKRFVTSADEYVKSILPNLGGHRTFHKKLKDLPHVRFGGVVASLGRFWLIGYVTGSSPADFLHNAGYAFMNFTVARNSKIGPYSSMIALVNNEAEGYRPQQQEAQLEELQKVTHRAPIIWTQKEEMIAALSTFTT